VPDEDILKKNIPAFFDILFALLDKNNDGNIDKQELQPILLMLQLAKFTSIESTEEPIETFIQIVEGNEKENIYSKFIKEIFCRTNWKKNPHIKFQLSGTRVMIITRNRNRIACFVSLAKKPLAFRLEVEASTFINKLKNAKWNSDELKDFVLSKGFIKDMSESKLTGYGNTLVSIKEIVANLSKERSRILLNVILISSLMQLVWIRKVLKK